MASQFGYGDNAVQQENEKFWGYLVDNFVVVGKGGGQAKEEDNNEQMIIRTTSKGGDEG